MPQSSTNLSNMNPLFASLEDCECFLRKNACQQLQRPVKDFQSLSVGGPIFLFALSLIFPETSKDQLLEQSLEAVLVALKNHPHHGVERLLKLLFDLVCKEAAEAWPARERTLRSKCENPFQEGKVASWLGDGLPGKRPFIPRPELSSMTQEWISQSTSPDRPTLPVIHGESGSGKTFAILSLAEGGGPLLLLPPRYSA